MQAWNVQVAATSLTAKANVGMSSYEAGLRADYYFRSWFIHATALTERTDDVISKATDVYIAEPAKRKEVANRYSPYWESSGSKGNPNEIMASLSGPARPVKLRSIQ